MGNKEGAVVLAAVVLLLVTGVLPAQVAGPEGMRKGVEFVRQPSGPHYDSPSARTAFGNMKHTTGASWVTIVPIWWQADTGRSAICSWPDSSPSDTELKSIIRLAHDSGMAVFLKPEIRCSTGVWIGRHKPHSESWFKYYRFFIIHYAQLAQETHCQMFSVGCDLDSTMETAWERDSWVSIITNYVKHYYLGPVTYAADWRTYRSVPFWDSLEVVGINAYFPPWVLGCHQPQGQLDMQNLAKEWKLDYIPEMEAFRDSLNLSDSVKPIIFTEIGYRSITGCAIEPWNDTVPGSYDPTEQRDCYMAALHSLLGKPWFAGWFWHEWTTDPNQGGTNDLSYSPKGKPAQEVLRRWFASIETQKSAEVPGWDCDRYAYSRTDSSLISLAEHNANWVQFVGLWQANALNSTFDSIGPDRWLTATDSSLRHAIRFAHHEGLSVMLRAQVCGPSLQWAGQFDPTDSGVLDAWFNQYTNFMRHYAVIAQQESCEMFCTGVEIDLTTDDPGESALWSNEVMPAVRDSYSGPVVYGALCNVLYDGNAKIPRIWSLMDFAGIQAYFPLFPDTAYQGTGGPLDTSGVQHPNVNDLLSNRWSQGWNDRWIPKLKALYDSVQKPVVFTEIGYRSIDSTAWYTSSNGAVGWGRETSGVTDNLRSVCFPVDTMTGYVVGDNGRILKTTNSGSNWSTCSSGTTNRLYSVDFPVADTGYAVGEGGTILKTTDGWSSHENKACLGVTVPLYSACFPLNPGVGFVVGDSGVILRTTNGGNSWTRFYCVKDSDTVRVALRSIALVPNYPQPLVGYIVGDGGTVLKSDAGGTTWQVLTTPVTVNLNGVGLVSPETCFVAGDSDHLICTMDGGETWVDSVFHVFRPGHWEHDLRAVCVPDYHSARFMAGSGGAVLRAGDGWPFSGSGQNTYISTDMSGIECKSFRHGEGETSYVEYVGFAVGDDGTILKAPHGGRMIVDLNEQANCYEAAFEAFWGSRLHPSPPPWFYGFHFWMWEPDPEPMTVEHESQIDMCTPQQKPAGEIMRQWYDWPSLAPQDTWACLVRHYPTGDLHLVLPANDKVNEPLVLCKLESHNWEAGGSADSARLLQEYDGQGDTLLAADTTVWFRFTTDTTWRFLHGRGKYSFYVQYMDVPNKVSPPYPDLDNWVVVFDTTGPSGSVVINSGARFTTSSTCALRLAAHDSTSGVGWMRFMNVPKANLAKNGSFVATAGSWSFTNGAYDTSLAMAKLSAGSSQAGVRQFVPAESISAHSGDSCVLEASILALMHGGNATGDVSFWYWFTKQDTSQDDTLWQLADSACYSGDLLSRTGRYDLSSRFLLTTPAAESGWNWRGGMVRVRAQGVGNGVGNVWTDNVGIYPYQPQTDYAWWGTYDTLAAWNIGTGAGPHAVRALFLDSAGNENATTICDTVMLDTVAPVVHISLPSPGQLVSGSAVEVTGWAYDPIEVSADSWFKWRTLKYRQADSTNWLPVSPDSISHTAAYPDSQQILGPAVHLGYWNTSSLQDGDYYLMLSASDSAGHVSSCTTWVVVSNGGTGGGVGGGPGGGGSGMGRGSVYIGSTSGCVLHLSDDLTPLDSFTVSDSGSQAYVTSILEVGNDSLLVLDARGKRVHKLHKSGQGRRRLVSGLSEPMDVKRDTSGNFWLVDRGIHKIGKFRSNGTLVFVRGGLGADSLHFHSPEGIAIKGSLVYVADTKNDRIAVWDTAGNYKKTITGDFARPTAVLPSDQGAIYLTDNNDGKLKGITPLGGSIIAIRTSDSSKLRGLVLSENRHHLFSLAPQPNKVYKLRIQSDDSAPGGQQSAGKVILPKVLSLSQPFPNPARHRLHIAYALPRATRVSVKLYDISGKLVNTLASGQKKPGYYSIVWNRQDARGRSVPCGVYFCTMIAENKRFSKKVVLTE